MTEPEAKKNVEQDPSKIMSQFKNLVEEISDAGSEESKLGVKFVDGNMSDDSKSESYGNQVQLRFTIQGQQA